MPSFRNIGFRHSLASEVDRPSSVWSKKGVMTVWGRKPSEPKKRRAIPTSVKTAVRQRDGDSCRKCGSKDNLQFDHVKPVSRGGKNTVKNLQLLCGPHNREKGVSKRYKVNNPPSKQSKARTAGRPKASGGGGWFGGLFGG